MQWRVSANGDANKPDAVQFDYGCGTVFVRRNFTKKKKTEGDMPTPEHWEYDEIKVPLDTWEFMKTLMEHTEEITESQDASTELAVTTADNSAKIEELQLAVAELSSVAE